MGRRTSTAVVSIVESTSKGSDATREASMNLAKREMDQATTEVLDRFGFEGYTVDRLIVEGTLHTRRFTESILELGRIVLALRELGRGFYGEAIARMGISLDTARRVAGVALKFWGKEHRQSIMTLDVGKVYELALLDDKTLDDIADDPEKIDEYDRMSLTEMRKALREKQAQLDAKDVVAEKHQKKIQQLQEKIARTPPPTPELLIEETLRELDNEALSCAARVSAGLRAAIGRTLDLTDAHGAERQLLEQGVSAALGRVFAATRDLVTDFNILPLDVDSLNTADRENAGIWDQVNADLAKAAPASKKQTTRHA